MRNSKTKYVMNNSISVIKCIGGCAFSVAKFVTKQSFRGLRYICNKISDAFEDKENYNSNNRNVACIKHDNIIPYQHQQLCRNSNNLNVGNGFSEQEYNKPIHPNCRIVMMTFLHLMIYCENIVTNKYENASHINSIYYILNSVYM